MLFALDADSGEPIEHVTFVKENLLAEDWAVSVGTTGKDWDLEIPAERHPDF